MSEFPSLRIISEPGRFFAGPAFTIVLNVIARHTIDYGDSNSEGLFVSIGFIFHDWNFLNTIKVFLF